MQILDGVILNPDVPERRHPLLGRVIQECANRGGPQAPEAGNQPRPAEPLPTGG